MALTLTVAARNAAADAVVALINAGGAGTIQIATDSGFGTVLALLTMSTTAFGAASSGTVTANSITSDTNTVAGAAAVFRIRSGAGTEILRGTVGTGSADIVFNTTTFTSGGICSISSLTISQP
jgi:hypothetical protein